MSSCFYVAGRILQVWFTCGTWTQGWKNPRAEVIQGRQTLLEGRTPAGLRKYVKALIRLHSVTPPSLQGCTRKHHLLTERRTCLNTDVFIVRWITRRSGGQPNFAPLIQLPLDFNLGLNVQEISTEFVKGRLYLKPRSRQGMALQRSSGYLASGLVVTVLNGETAPHISPLFRNELKEQHCYVPPQQHECLHTSSPSYSGFALCWYCCY